ncbi:MAG: AMP-binding protein, partial [Candidatus Diapherotrites archaeon]
MGKKSSDLHIAIPGEWVPREETLGGTLDAIAEKFPKNDALVYPRRKFRLSYAEFRGKCDELAKGLMALGIKKGDKVSAWANNVPEWVLLQFATAKIGAVLVTVNTAYKARELEYLLKQSDTTTLFVIKEFKGVDFVGQLLTVAPEIGKSRPGKLKTAKLPLLKNIVFIGEQKM